MVTFCDRQYSAWKYFCNSILIQLEFYEHRQSVHITGRRWRASAGCLKAQPELEGYEVTTANDGSAALKAIENEYFDLVIMDVMMPEMDGIIKPKAHPQKRSTYPDAEC